jgi:CRP-like cAMP-binding protein
MVRRCGPFRFSALHRLAESDRSLPKEKGKGLGELANLGAADAGKLRILEGMKRAHASTVPIPGAAAAPSLETLGCEPLTPEQLVSLSFFAGLSPAQLERIAPHTMVTHFATGTQILEQGLPADRFYVMVSGRVGIEYRVAGSSLLVQAVGPGEALGFSWLVMPEKLHFSARALEPVTAVFCYGTLLQKECEHSPRLGMELMRRAAEVMMQRMDALLERYTAEARRLEESTWHPRHRGCACAGKHKGT